MIKKRVALLFLVLLSLYFLTGCSTFRSIRNSIFGGKKERVVTAEDVDVPETTKKIKDWNKLSRKDKKKYNKAVKLVNKANDEFKKKKYSAAIKDAKAAIKEWKDLPKAYLVLGNSYYKNNEFNNAIKALDTYTEYDNKDSKAYYTKGLSYENMDDYDNALRNFLIVTKITPKDPIVHLEIANLYKKKKSTVNAVEYYRKTYKLDKNIIDAYLGEGNIYLEIKDYKKAKDVFEKGLKIKADARLKRGLAKAEGILYFRKARNFFKDNKFGKAEENFLKSIKLLPTHYDANYLLGYTYFKQKKFDEAVKFFKKAIEINKEKKEPYLMLASIYRKKKKYIKAIDILNKAKQKWSKDFKIYNLIGIIYGESGSFYNAVDALKIAVKLNKKSAEAYQNLGVAYFEVENYNMALTNFRKVLKLKPDSKSAAKNLNKTESIILVNMGNKLFDEKKYLKAVKNYEKALKINPSFIDAKINLANTYVELADIENNPQKQNAYLQKAIKKYKEVLKKDKENFPALRGIERAYRTSGNINEAKKYTKILEGLKGKDPSIYYKLGLSLEQKQKFHDAIKEYKTALQVDRGFKKAKIRIATCYYKNGLLLFNKKKYEEANSEFQKALNYNPNYFDALDKINYLKALKFIKLADEKYVKGDYEGTINNYLKALEVYNKLKEVYLNIAHIYLIQRKFAAAEKILLKGVKIEPNYEDFYITLGLISQRKKDYSEAYQYFNKALELNPNDDSIYNDIGELFLKQKSYDEAIKFFEKSVALNSKNLEARINLGIAYFKKGDFYRARDEFEAVVKLNKKYDPGYFNLGLVYYKLNKYSKSKRNFEEAIKLRNDIPSFYFYYGRTLFYMEGMIDASIKNIEKALSMRQSPLYYYGAGKVYEKKLKTATSVAYNKYLNLAIKSYKQVISMVRGTKLAQWAEENLLGLIPDVRLMNAFIMDSEVLTAPIALSKFIFSGDKFGSVYVINPESNEKPVNKVATLSGGISVIQPDKDKVLFGTEAGFLYKYNTAPYREIWHISLSCRINKIISSGDNYIVCDNSGFVYFLSKISGDILHKLNIGSRAVDAKVLKSTLILSTEEGGITAVNMQTKNILWDTFVSGRILKGFGVKNEKLYVGTDNGLLYCLDNRGKIIFRKNFAQPIKSNVVSDGKVLYFASGNLFYAVNGAGNVLWKYVADSDIVSKIGLWKDIAVFSTERGRVYSLKASSGKKNWIYKHNFEISTEPLIVSDNTLFIGADDGEVLQLYYKKMKK